MGLPRPHPELPDRPLCPGESNTPAVPAERRRFNPPLPVPRQYNGTADGVYTVHTGKDDISKVGVIESWRGNK